MSDDTMPPRRRTMASPIDRLSVIVVRVGNAYSWEIRRYGAVVQLRGTEHFQTAAEARVAGEAKLSSLLM